MYFFTWFVVNGSSQLVHRHCKADVARNPRADDVTLSVASSAMVQTEGNVLPCYHFYYVIKISRTRRRSYVSTFFYSFDFLKWKYIFFLNFPPKLLKILKKVFLCQFLYLERVNISYCTSSCNLLATWPQIESVRK